MTDLDALTALLAAATTYCEQHMEMEHVNQIPPCAGARHEAEWWAEAFRLPALIEAARREAGLRELVSVYVNSQICSCNEEPYCPDRLFREQARDLLHASAGTATGDEVGEPE